MRGENLQAWLVEATWKDRPVTDKWDKVVDIIQTDLREGWIPVECEYQKIVLLPKGNGELCGIGIFEVIWKAVSGVVNFWIGMAVNIHDTLHRFREVRGTGTTSLESKLLHQMMKMREEVLYEVFLNLQKVYNSLDRERCLKTLVG